MIQALLLTTWLLAHVIAGETGTICGLDAKLAVANVAANRTAAGIEGGWAGWAEPTPLDLLVAEKFQKLVDPTRGALFLLSRQDVGRRDVAAWLVGRQRTAVFECAGGLALEAWR